MENQKEIRLSSPFTKVSLFIGATLLILIIPVSVLAVMDAREFHFGMVLAPIILIALLAFFGYLFVYVCEAKISGTKLVVKKLFRPAQTIDFIQIGYISSFRLKRTKYTTFEIKKGRGVFEKAIIMNSKSILSFEKMDAEEVLRYLKSEALNLKVPGTNP